MSIQVTEVCGTELFHELHEQWNELLSRSAHNEPFLRHEWIQTWSDCFAEPGTFTTIIARANGKLVFALPLVQRMIGRGPLAIQTLQSATNSHSFRYHFIMDDGCPDILKHVMEYLYQRRAWHVLQLSYVPFDDESHQQLLKQAGDCGLSGHTKLMFDSAVLPIEGTWDAHLAGLKKSFKKTMRRQERRLQEAGEVRVEVFEKESEVLQALPEAFEIERQSWKGDQGSAIACQPAVREFYTSIAQQAAALGWMRLSFLNVGGTRTAFEFAFEYQRRFYSIKIGYNPENYSTYSVGRRLVHESIARSFGAGLEAYDFVGAYSAAQEHWAPKVRPIGWIYIYNRRIVSKLLSGWEFSAKPRLKQLLDPIRNRGH